jgi:hypothetical protein
VLGGVLPLVPVGHGLGEGLFLGQVALAHRLVAGGPELMPPGPLVVALLAGGFRFGALDPNLRSRLGRSRRWG